jgi:hypothetical protein
MKAFKRPAYLALYILHSGFQAFKLRLQKKLFVCRGINLDNYADDEYLFRYYQRGEPVSYVIEGCVAEWILNPVRMCIAGD